MTTNNLCEVVRHYQRRIERHQDDDAKLLHCITKLYHLPIKVEHLQETGIGKSINSLRKFSGETGIAAKTLVTKWKAMVADEQQPSEIPDPDDDMGKNNSLHRGSSDEDQCDRNGTLPMETVTQHLPIESQSREQSKSREHQSGNDNSSHHKSKSLSISSGTSKHNTSSSRHRSSHSKHSKNNEKHHKSYSDKSKEGERTSRHHGDHDKRKDDSKRSEAKKAAELNSKNESRSNETNRHEKSEHKEKHKERRDNNAERHDKHTSSKHGDRNKKREHDKDKPSKQSDEKNKSSSSSSHSSNSKPSSSDKIKSPKANKKRRNSVEIETPISKVVKVDKALTNEDDESLEDGIDSSMGANFAEVLGMLNMPSKKLKKSMKTTINSKSMSSSVAHKDDRASTSASTSSSKNMNIRKSNTLNGLVYSNQKYNPEAKPELLSSTAKLEPLDPSIALELPSISTNYKPMPLNQTVMDVVFNTSASTSSSANKPTIRTLTDSEALAHGISSKTMRTKIYSGSKPGQINQVLSLFDLCIRILQKNIDALEYTGGVPFEVLRPVLERASPQQLLIFEDYNPYLMEDSDVLWKQHVQRQYRTQRRQEMESWREMFLRCQEDQERKLSILAENIKQSQKIIAAPVRKTQMAFIDSMVKPPRNIARKQEQYGTKSKLIATPAARVSALSSVTPNAAKPGDTRLRVAAATRDTAQIAAAPMRQKKAPLMAKTLQFMRGRHKR